MNIPTDLAIAIVGGVVVLIIQWLVQWIRERGGDFTGTWDQLVFATENLVDPVKRDVVQCRQIGSSVHATISRVSPTDQQHRTWSFSGRYFSETLFGYFWSKSERNPSFGTIFLRQTNEDSFRGFYVRYHRVVQDWDQDTVTITRIPLEWRKRN